MQLLQLLVQLRDSLLPSIRDILHPLSFLLFQLLDVSLKLLSPLFLMLQVLRRLHQLRVELHQFFLLGSQFIGHPLFLRIQIFNQFKI